MCSNASITEIFGINDKNLAILGNEKSTSIAISLLCMLPHNLIDFVDLNYHQRYLT